MAKNSKRFKKITGTFEEDKSYSLKDALEILKKCPEIKFDQSVEISLMTGVDPKKSDQQVRSTVLLPKGTGKKTKILVLAKDERAKEAMDAGADFAGSDELIEKIKGGWLEFDQVVATPDMMREVGKLGKVLGPRGLMPTPKAGTVTTDVKKAVEELQKGKVEFKVDKSGVINNLVGKLSFAVEDLVENTKTLISAIVKMKPASAKGVYLKSLFVSSTMGPGIKIDINSVL